MTKNQVTRNQEGKERMHIRLSKESIERLQNVSDRYGLTPNSLVAYIVGEWLDEREKDSKKRNKRTSNDVASSRVL